MNALLELLQKRSSSPANRLTVPAPSDQEIAEILRCAVAAPDHARLRPWRFVVIRDNARHALGNVFADVARSKEPNCSEEKLQRLREKPLRAPLIITVVTRLTSGHPKTPEVEQRLSAGAAAQQLLLGANALGFGAIWLTGPNAYDPQVKSALSLGSNEEIAGFIYIGTESSAPTGPANGTPTNAANGTPTKTDPTNGTPTITNTKTKTRPDVKDHVSEWPGS